GPPASPSPPAAGRRNSPLSRDWATSTAETCRGEICSAPPGGSGAGAAPAGLQPFQLVQHLVQSQARDELHDVVVQAVLRADAEDRDDVGVVQAGGRLRLPLEPLALAVVKEELRQHLQGDVPAQGDLLGLIDDAHAAPADLAQDAVVAQPRGVAR